MKYRKESLKEDQSKDIYWSRLHVSSDDESKKTTVIYGASDQFLQMKFNKAPVEMADARNWEPEVIKKWESKGETILDKKIHYDPYGSDEEGNQNLTNVLKNL